MRGVLTIIPVGEAAVIRKELAAAPHLEDLQSWIGGGFIELVPYFTKFEGKPCVAFCDEDGKHKGMPANTRATDLWYALEPRFMGRDILVGPIVIVTGDKQLMEEL
jgi:hypothetical protein